MRDFDVIVVGGGPAGSLSALNLCGSGFNVALFEEHQSAGFPAQCAGLVSEDCLKVLERFVDTDKCLLNRINGAYFFAPDGGYVRAEGKSKAAVVERKIMDIELLKRASTNAEVFVKEKALYIDKKNECYILKTNRQNYSSCYVVGADGVYSTVAKCLNFERPRILSAVQVECKFECMNEKYVELYFGRKYSNLLFCYAVPTGDGFARIGAVSSNNAVYWLNRLLREHPSVSRRVEEMKICELNCGAIPFGLIDFVKDKAVLIGDSAGMVKPYTGGGIYYTAVAAECLGKCFPDLEAFKESYLKALEKEYAIGYRIAKLYRMLSDEDYSYLIKLARGIEFRELHMDKPTSALKVLPALLKLLKSPKLFLKIAKCLL